MIKGTKIKNIIIDNDNIITAIDTNGNKIKLTRSQRDLLRNYKNPDYEKKVIKEFSNPNILSNDFAVIKHDKVVYQKKNN